MDIGSAITGTADVIGTYISDYKNSELDIKMTQAQNNWNRESWNMQNAYNDPSAQMQRIRNAGLNPNLMYSQGNTGNAGSIAPSGKANVGINPPSMLDKYTKAMQNELIPYQVDLTKQQLENKIVEEKILNQELSKKERENRIGVATENLTIGAKEQDLQNKKQVLENLKAENARIGADTEMKNKQQQYLDGQISIQEVEKEWKDKGMENAWWPVKMMLMWLNEAGHVGVESDMKLRDDGWYE